MQLYKITAIDKSSGRIITYLSFTKEHQYNSHWFDITIEEIQHNLKCFSCSKEMTMIDYMNYKTSEDFINGLVSDGLIDSIKASYGSSQDASVFLITICDDCLSAKLDCGNIIHIKDVY